jgi:hypothetical protein
VRLRWHEGIQSDVRYWVTWIYIGVFRAGFLHTILGRCVLKKG